MAHARGQSVRRRAREVRAFVLRRDRARRRDLQPQRRQLARRDERVLYVITHGYVGESGHGRAAVVTAIVQREARVPALGEEGLQRFELHAPAIMPCRNRSPSPDCAWPSSWDIRSRVREQGQRRPAAWQRGIQRSQWVLTFPFGWRLRLGQDGALLGTLTRLFVQTVQAFYAARAAASGVSGAKTGAVTVVQRTSSRTG
jgi:hypothetical protein